jgi:hypothetical protein
VEPHKSNRLKKTLAILLLVLFIVSLTAITTSAAPSCKGPKPACVKENHVVCVNGLWKCVPNCPGLKPICRLGHPVCIFGHWKCL